MDWVDEKMETFRIWIRNLPIKKALIAYLCIAAVAALLLSFATTQVCERWMDILVERNALDMGAIMFITMRRGNFRPGSRPG